MSRPALDGWPTDAGRQRLEGSWPGLAVEVVAELGSTNGALLERVSGLGADGDVHDGDVRRGDAAASPAQVRRSVESTAFRRPAVAMVRPCLLVAERQTDGRGRLGRRWHAAPGASLTFSVGVALQRADLSGLSLAVGIALAEALGPALSVAAAQRLGLKWPNDLCLADAAGSCRKLGGVLIETRPVGDRRWVVIGIGLNIAPLPAALATVDPGIDAGAIACMHELDPSATAAGVLARVAPPLLETLRQFEHGGFAGFADRYAALDLLAGQPVRSFGAAAVEGIGRGVAANGALRVETADGVVRSLVGGEVSVRLAGAAVAPC